MRYYIHGRHSGVSFGLFGSLAAGSLVALCAVAALGIIAEALAMLIPAALLALAVYVIDYRIQEHRRYLARSVRIRWARPEESRQWVYRERWPHAVAEGGWLDRHR